MVSAPELQVWLLEQELGEYCYIIHIAVDYNGDDRPTGKGKFRRWLKQLSFLMEFQDGEGKECVRLKAGGGAQKVPAPAETSSEGVSSSGGVGSTSKTIP